MADFVSECRAYGISRIFGMSPQRAMRELSDGALASVRRSLHLMGDWNHPGIFVRCDGCGAPEQFGECEYCGRECG